MSDHKATMDMREEKLINLNKVEVLLGVVVAVIAIGSAVGVWYVIPYRVAKLEEGQATQRVEFQQRIAGLQIQFDSMQKDSQVQKELLIRIDERLRILQVTLDRSQTRTP